MAQKKNKNPSVTTEKKTVHEGHFKSGEQWRGNAKGRPKGARHKLSELFLKDFLEIWEQAGQSSLERMIVERPSDFVKVAASLLPAEKNVNVQGNHTVTHKQEDISETLRWLEAVAGTGAEGKAEKPLLN